jgi:hypothetical protein
VSKYDLSVTFRLEKVTFCNSQLTLSQIENASASTGVAFELDRLISAHKLAAVSQLSLISA